MPRPESDIKLVAELRANRHGQVAPPPAVAIAPFSRGQSMLSAHSLTSAQLDGQIQDIASLQNEEGKNDSRGAYYIMCT